MYIDYCNLRVQGLRSSQLDKEILDYLNIRYIKSIVHFFLVSSKIRKIEKDIMF